MFYILKVLLPKFTRASYMLSVYQLGFSFNWFWNKIIIIISWVNKQVREDDFWNQITTIIYFFSYFSAPRFRSFWNFSLFFSFPPPFFTFLPQPSSSSPLVFVPFSLCFNGCLLPRPRKERTQSSCSLYFSDTLPPCWHIVVGVSSVYLFIFGTSFFSFGW